jgi:hypothetical protein
MKNIFAVVCLIFTSFAFSQKNDKPNNPVKEVKKIEEIMADFDKDGKIDKAFHYQGLESYLSKEKNGVNDTIYLVKIEFSNKKVLETKPIKLESGKIKISYNEKSNVLSIILSPEDEYGMMPGRFPTTKTIDLKYDNKISNFIALRSESNSLNLIIETDFIKKTRKYIDADDGYNALINDEKGNNIWLKKINYKESIKQKNLKFTDMDLSTFNMVSKKSNGFDAYVKKEIKNISNRN